MTVVRFFVTDEGKTVSTEQAKDTFYHIDTNELSAFVSYPVIVFRILLEH